METTYNPAYMEETLVLAAHILKWGVGGLSRDWEGAEVWAQVSPPRRWHAREQTRYDMHRVVAKAIKLARPNNWQQLLLEWPHAPVGGYGTDRIAYTQSEAKGERDLQTVTSLGKYLRSRFGTLPDHAIRDLVASCTAQGMRFVHTTAEMIYHLHRGPASCMVWGDADSDPDTHPYRAYDPKYGWHMCVHTESNGTGEADTIGRALCNSDGDTKFYVRTYRKTSGSSSRDEQMEQWLGEQGYQKADSWDDCLLAYHDGIHGGAFLAPYLDGDYKQVSVTRVDGVRALRVTQDGEYECNTTNGIPDLVNSTPCESCSERISEDDGYWVGLSTDSLVCTYCYGEHYTSAYGYRGNEYAVHNNDTVYVESQGAYYHDSHLDHNNIVCLENGEYEHTDNAVEIDGAWYHIEDDDIRTLENGDIVLEDDAYECAESGKWYSLNDEPPVEVDGQMYHPDNAPDPEETTESTD